MRSTLPLRKAETRGDARSDLTDRLEARHEAGRPAAQNEGDPCQPLCQWSIRSNVVPQPAQHTLQRIRVDEGKAGPRGDLVARSLSAGQKRRLALARLLLSGATLWILDEPVTNLDTAGIELVEELITEHVNKGGLALSAAHQRLLDHAHFLRRLELT